MLVAAEEPYRSTLLVRIMAAGPALPEAIADLAARPEDAYERAVAEQIVVHLRHVIGDKPGQTPEEEEFIVSMQGTWKEARAEGRTEGRAEGRAEGEARALLTALRVRGIAVPEAMRERILAQKDAEQLDRWLEKAIVATSLAEVLGEPS